MGMVSSQVFFGINLGRAGFFQLEMLETSICFVLASHCAVVLHRTAVRALGYRRNSDLVGIRSRASDAATPDLDN